MFHLHVHIITNKLLGFVVEVDTRTEHRGQVTLWSRVTEPRPPLTTRRGRSLSRGKLPRLEDVQPGQWEKPHTHTFYYSRVMLLLLLCEIWSWLLLLLLLRVSKPASDWPMGSVGRRLFLLVLLKVSSADTRVG